MLADLRFRPANSNDGARARIAHHFGQVPRCSFARDDGISHYLGSQSQIDSFPTAPATFSASPDKAPEIDSEAPGAITSLGNRFARGGFGFSVFLHAVAAVAIGYATLTLPSDDSLIEGVTSVSIVVEGNSEIAQTTAGDIEDNDKPEDRPLPDTDLKPVETLMETRPDPVVEIRQPVEASAQDVLKNVPMPMLGLDIPEILTTTQAAEAKADIPAELAPVEEKVEKAPEEKPKPVANKPEDRKDKPEKKEPKITPETKIEKKDKPREKRRTNKGNLGNATSDADRGDVDASKAGKTASESSRGDSRNREIGNAAHTNYKGLVQKKLQRAKGRVQSPGKGKVTIAFTIGANGDVTGLRVTRSSGKQAIDAAALKIVRNASPFPAIPADSGRKSWKMSVPIEFKG